jgi:hypothetical protein
MSKSIGDQLPGELRSLLAGTDLKAAVGRTFPLLTAQEDGSVSIALLSAGEILAVDGRHLRLALWPGTTSTRNLTRTGRATIQSIDPGGALYVRLQVERGPDIQAAGRHYAAFEATVEAILDDEVTYARIADGIRFELYDQPAVLARWRETITALRALGTGAAAEAS